MHQRHITRVVMSDGSKLAELWVHASAPCALCGGADQWDSPNGAYAICLSRRQGWEPARSPRNAADNPVLAQIVAQLDRAVSAA